MSRLKFQDICTSARAIQPNVPVLLGWTRSNTLAVIDGNKNSRQLYFVSDLQRPAPLIAKKTSEVEGVLGALITDDEDSRILLLTGSELSTSTKVVEVSTEGRLALTSPSFSWTPVGIWAAARRRYYLVLFRTSQPGSFALVKYSYGSTEPSQVEQLPLTTRLGAVVYDPENESVTLVTRNGMNSRLLATYSVCDLSARINVISTTSLHSCIVTACGRWYVLTHHNHSHRYIAAFDIMSGHMTPVVQTDDDIDTFTVGKNGRIAYALNRSGQTIVGVCAHAGQPDVLMDPGAPGQPLVIDSIALASDGETLAFSGSGMTSYPNIWISAMDGLRPRAVFKRRGDLRCKNATPFQVKTQDGLCLPCWQYMPTGLQEGNKGPCLVWIHGGPLQQHRPEYQGNLQVFLKHQISVIGINYRGSTGSGVAFERADDGEKRVSAVDDIVEVISWIACTLHPTAIVLYGHSYGAVLAFCAASRCPHLSVVSESGLYNLPAYVAARFGGDEIYFQEEFDHSPDNDVLYALSPANLDLSGVRSVLMFHGSQDETVPIYTARQMFRNLCKQKTKVAFFEMHQERHVFSRRAQLITIYLTCELAVNPQGHITSMRSFSTLLISRSFSRHVVFQGSTPSRHGLANRDAEFDRRTLPIGDSASEVCPYPSESSSGQMGVLIRRFEAEFVGVWRYAMATGITRTDYPLRIAEFMARRATLFLCRRAAMYQLTLIPGALAAFRGALSRSIQQLIEPCYAQNTLEAYLRPPNEQHFDGLKEAEDLCKSFPTLPLWLFITVNNMVNDHVALLFRLSTDSFALKTLVTGTADTATVAAISPAISDVHDDGQAVHIVTFGCGDRVVYKPRQLSAEREFSELIGRIITAGVPIKIRIPNLICFKSHSWMEWIEEAPPKDAVRYCVKLGQLLCLLHLLGAADMHSENIICDGIDPIVVDLETCPHPRRRQFGNLETPSDFRAFDQQWLNILSTGILPYWTRRRNGVIRDESHLGQVLANEGGDNAPKELFEACRAGLIEGFANAYNGILSRRLAVKTAFSMFGKGSKRRLLIRDTIAYEELLRELHLPSALTSGKAQAKILNRLRAAFAVRGTMSNRFSRVFDREHRSLSVGNIPRFFWSEKESDEYIGSFALRIPRISRKDLTKQILYINLAFEVYSDANCGCRQSSGSLSRDSRANRRESLDDLVLRAARKFIAAAEKFGPHLVWIGGPATPRFLNSGPLPDDLYSGSIGISVSLAALFRVTGRVWLRNAALGSLPQLRRIPAWYVQSMSDIRGIFGLQGLHGVIYGLELCERLLRSQKFGDDWLSVVEQLFSMPPPDQGEWMRGLSGSCAILAGLIENGRTSPKLLDQLSGYRKALQSTSNNHLDCTFAHGIAGKCYAIARANYVDGRTRRSVQDRQIFTQVREAASRGMASHSWVSSLDNSWCRGLAGHACALMSGGKRDREISLKIADHFANAFQSTPTEEAFSLCCGVLGRIDAALEVSLMCRDRSFDGVRDYAGEAIRLACKRFLGDSHQSFGGYGLFRGYAGIFYLYARITAPELVPSVLLVK